MQRDKPLEIRADNGLILVVKFVRHRAGYYPMSMEHKLLRRGPLESLPPPSQSLEEPVRRLPRRSLTPPSSKPNKRSTKRYAQAQRGAGWPRLTPGSPCLSDASLTGERISVSEA